MKEEEGDEKEGKEEFVVDIVSLVLQVSNNFSCAGN